MRGSTITGIGRYVPSRVMTNHELEKLVDTTDEWIVSRTGIRERRIAAPDEASSDLAFHAAMEALADAGVTPEQIDLIVVGTATPDMLFPATACILQDRLGARHAGAFDLSAACSSWVYAVAVAHGYIASGLAETVLVVGAEVLSKFTNWKDRNTCVLFGDSAGAVVMQPCEPGRGFLSFYLGADGSGAARPRGHRGRRLVHSPSGEYSYHRRGGGTAGPTPREVFHQRRALWQHLLRVGAGRPVRGGAGGAYQRW